jgi:alginate O-acetyltransferase complex protein AlgJ
MNIPQQSLPSGGKTREALAIMEIAHTNVSPTTVGFLVAFFLIAIVAVPAVEFWTADEDEGVTIAFSQLSMAADEIRYSPETAGDKSPWRRLIAANAILLGGLTGFEQALEDESLIARSLRPAAQLLMTGWLGAGNERVYPGRESWLFYRPDVEYLTGRPFLDPSQMRKRLKETPVSEALPQPDPRRAIVELNGALEARGIMLVVMPTPHKPAVHPDKLSAGYDVNEGTLQNPSFPAFVDDLERAGVRVFKPAEALAEADRGVPQYLATDTHWRPEAMALVAEGLAEFISARVSLPAVDDPGYRLDQAEARNVGDTARMLDLPENAALFPTENVQLRRVLQADGSPWRSSRTADVLVLGDSFSNIYGLESMGWGTSAGFVEQLSYALRRPVDRLVQNDQGAFATRAMLGRDPARLDGKRVVVYQFAERELAFGDWKLIALPSASLASGP